MEYLLLLALVFFVVSTVFAMLGLGGGILYVPILLFAGFTIKQAPAISLILIATTSLAAMSVFLRRGNIDWKLALVIDPPTDIMAFIGSYYFSNLVPEAVLKVLLAAILLLAGYLMRQKMPQRRDTPLPAAWGRWRRNFNGVDYAVNLPLVISSCAAIGLLCGMLGVTGGIIKLALMVLACGVPMDIAVATSTVMVSVTALSGLAGYVINGQVDWHSGAILAIAAVCGGLLGGRISLKVDKMRLKRIFAMVVWLVALRLLWSVVV